MTPADGTVAGLLLAAGGGRRLGQPKALVRLGGGLLVERGIRLLIAADCDPVVVVLGASAPQVRARADLGTARVVVNGNWATGMSSSLRAGLAALEFPAAGAVPAPRPDAVVITLVDQPDVTSAAISRLIVAWRTGAVAAVATFAGEQRNPVLLDRTLWPAAAAAATGDRGARALLRSRPDLVTPVPCDDVASAADIDTPADLAGFARTDSHPAPEEPACS